MQELVYSRRVCLGVFKNQGTTALGWVFKTQASIQWVRRVENKVSSFVSILSLCIRTAKLVRICP